MRWIMNEVCEHFFFKYLNIKKSNNGSFFKVGASVLGATISQHHVPFNIIILFNIIIQIIFIMLTTLMERRAKYWWAGIWRWIARYLRRYLFLSPPSMCHLSSMDLIPHMSDLWKRDGKLVCKDLKFTRHSCCWMGLSERTWCSRRNISKCTVERRF